MCQIILVGKEIVYFINEQNFPSYAQDDDSALLTCNQYYHHQCNHLTWCAIGRLFTGVSSSGIDLQQSLQKSVITENFYGSSIFLPAMQQYVYLSKARPSVLSKTSSEPLLTTLLSMSCIFLAYVINRVLVSAALLGSSELELQRLKINENLKSCWISGLLITMTGAKYSYVTISFKYYH